jgi:hypothetical protein
VIGPAEVAASKVVCNLAARELGRFLAQHDLADVARWAKAREDLAARLPADFEVPLAGIQRHLALAAVRRMGERAPDGSCPAWDLILQNLHDAAATTAFGARQAGQPEVLATARKLQAMAALLGRQDVRPWYYENMDRLRQRVLARLEAG